MAIVLSPFTLFNNGLLDNFPGAAAAFSLRNLSQGYMSNVVRVRRSSDDAEADFTAQEMNDGTLTSWVGVGNDGFVKIWYDQSGGGYDAIQSTNAAQPQIVDNGLLITENGKPALSFTPSQLLTATVAGLRDFTNVSLFSLITPELASQADAHTQVVFGMALGGGNNDARGSSGGGATNNLSGEHYCIFFAGESSGRLGSSTYRHSAQEQILHTIFMGESGTQAYKNSESISLDLTGNINTSTNTSLANGAFTQDTLHFNSVNGINRGCTQKQQEFILYASNKSIKRTAIEDAINSYYAIS